MAASQEINPALIAQVKESEVPVPWCEEFSKMISGMKSVRPRLPAIMELYADQAPIVFSFSASGVPELSEFRLDVLRKRSAFNDESIPDGSTLASLTARRMAVAKTMFGRLGGSVNIEPLFFITWGCNTFIGDNVYINRG